MMTLDRGPPGRRRDHSRQRPTMLRQGARLGNTGASTGLPVRGAAL